MGEKERHGEGGRGKGRQEIKDQMQRLAVGGPVQLSKNANRPKQQQQQQQPPLGGDVIIDNRKLVFGANNGSGWDKVFCPNPLPTEKHVAQPEVLPAPAPCAPPTSAPVYSPSSPSYDNTHSLTKPMTLDELCMAMYENPQLYSSNPKTPSFNADDLCQILKRNHVILQPTKTLCDLVLQHLHNLGYLKKN